MNTTQIQRIVKTAGQDAKAKAWVLGWGTYTLAGEGIPIADTAKLAGFDRTTCSKYAAAYELFFNCMALTRAIPKDRRRSKVKQLLDLRSALPIFMWVAIAEAVRKWEIDPHDWFALLNDAHHGDYSVSDFARFLNEENTPDHERFRDMVSRAASILSNLPDEYSLRDIDDARVSHSRVTLAKGLRVMSVWLLRPVDDIPPRVLEMATELAEIKI